MGWFDMIFKNKTEVKEKKTKTRAEALEWFAGGSPTPSGFLAVPAFTEIELKYPSIEPLNLMTVSFARSPNQSTRNGDVKYIVLHHTGPGSFNGIVKWLRNPQAKASAHYVVGMAAEIKQLVNSGKESWHLGVAKWKGKRIDNHKSIGIEICNLGVLERDEAGKFHYAYGRGVKEYKGDVEPVLGSITYQDGTTLEGYYVPYPDVQVEKVVALCKGLVAKYPAITRENIITHYDAAIPTGRKNDVFGLDMKMIRDRLLDAIK